MSNETPQSPRPEPEPQPDGSEDPETERRVPRRPGAANGDTAPEAEESAEESAPPEPVVTEHPVTAPDEDKPPSAMAEDADRPVTDAYDQGPQTGATWAPEPVYTPERAYSAEQTDVTQNYATHPTYAVPAAAPASGPVYLAAPVEPRKRSNRGVGTLIALLAALIFAIAYHLVVTVIDTVGSPGTDFGAQTVRFLVSPVFYVPVIFFAAAMIVLVLIVNRARWWVYIIGSFFVAVVVYFAFVGGALISEHFWAMTPREAGKFVATLWVNPFIYVAAIVAREVALWMGAWLAARGRTLKLKNAEAQAQYERDLAALPENGAYPQGSGGYHAPAL